MQMIGEFKQQTERREAALGAPPRVSFDHLLAARSFFCTSEVD